MPTTISTSIQKVVLTRYRSKRNGPGKHNLTSDCYHSSFLIITRLVSFRVNILVESSFTQHTLQFNLQAEHKWITQIVILNTIVQSTSTTMLMRIFEFESVLFITKSY